MEGGNIGSWGWRGFVIFFFFFQAEDGIRDYKVTGVQTCALPISLIRGETCSKMRVRMSGVNSLITQHIVTTYSAYALV